MLPRIRSVNLARPREASYATIGRSAIDKRAADGPVVVRRLGLDGDEVGDPKHHGGPDQAVYAYAREDLDWWSAELGADVPDGEFGENLTTEGYDVNAAELGERWAIGDAVLEVASVRIPCATFRGWQATNGYDTRAWQKRFTQAARPGPYLRVVAEGPLRAGDAIEVLRRPGHGVTVATMFRAITTEPDLLPELLAVDDLVPRARASAERWVAEHPPMTPRTGPGR
ncbi:sulfurase [Marmoricola endophyticus]|uniref:Sulfurase n=1 Tax=Marmoricola endophyticus TaxID=2040280 RepID=A0A917BCJ0_9ACTN|nr:MOSC domain-containing protein [Marmoricola endophyticus]GGF37184.1 sulfurase [Marmoricola endophyticus]